MPQGLLVFCLKILARPTPLGMQALSGVYVMRAMWPTVQAMLVLKSSPALKTAPGKRITPAPVMKATSSTTMAMPVSYPKMSALKIAEASSLTGRSSSAVQKGAQSFGPVVT